jgi:hypothetical protein
MVHISFLQANLFRFHSMTQDKKKNHISMWFHWAGICGFSGWEYVATNSGSDQLHLPGFLDRLHPLVDQQFTIEDRQPSLLSGF